MANELGWLHFSFASATAVLHQHSQKLHLANTHTLSQIHTFLLTHTHYTQPPSPSSFNTKPISVLCVNQAHITSRSVYLTSTGVLHFITSFTPCTGTIGSYGEQFNYHETHDNLLKWHILLTWHGILTCSPTLYPKQPHIKYRIWHFYCGPFLEK